MEQRPTLFEYIHLVFFPFLKILTNHWDQIWKCPSAGVTLEKVDQEIKFKRQKAYQGRLKLKTKGETGTLHDLMKSP